jgi:ABC-type Fe3+-hydroxamate transport system substrate-binding protein
MLNFTDQLGRTISVATHAKRIISLVPSQTELLYSLGLGEEVIGITRFCVHPGKWFREKQRVGGTKDFKLDLIRSLQPDLILANKEENEASLLFPLMEEFPVWVSAVSTLDNALEMISSVGHLCAKTERADALNTAIENGFNRLLIERTSTPVKVLYLIWQDPYMTIGYDTFIADMLRRCGLDTIYADRSRYPELTEEEISESGAAVVLLSSEPFPFSEKHINRYKKLLPNARILLCDGEYFSWYGSRLLEAPDYFRSLLAGLSG